MPPRYTDAELLVKAKANIERNLGNVVIGEDGKDTIEENMYALAFDAIWDAGVRGSRAVALAEKAYEDYKNFTD